MSVYGTDYFVNNISVLEEALDNELNNFNLMMESYTNNIEVVNELVENPISQIKTKLRTLWDKFWNWFKSIIREISSNIKINTLKSMKKKAENSTKDPNVAKIFRLDRDATSDYKSTANNPENIKKANEGIQNFINRNEKIISNVEILINQLSSSNSMESKTEKIRDELKNTKETLSKSDFILKSTGNTQSKDLIISAGDLYYSVVCKLNDQIQSLNKIIKKCDVWVKKYDKEWNTSIKDYDHEITNDEVATRESYYLLKDLISVMRDLISQTFKMLKQSYYISGYYYRCAAGKDFKYNKEK